MLRPCTGAGIAPRLSRLTLRRMSATSSLLTSAVICPYPAAFCDRSGELPFLMPPRTGDATFVKSTFTGEQYNTIDFFLSCQNPRNSVLKGKAMRLGSNLVCLNELRLSTGGCIRCGTMEYKPNQRGWVSDDAEKLINYMLTSHYRVGE